MIAKFQNEGTNELTTYIHSTIYPLYPQKKEKEKKSVIPWHA